jgi:hypothetical protein
MTSGSSASSMTPRGSGSSACSTRLTLRGGLAALPALTGLAGILIPALLCVLIVLGLILLILVLLRKGGTSDYGYSSYDGDGYFFHNETLLKRKRLRFCILRL